MNAITAMLNFMRYIYTIITYLALGILSILSLFSRKIHYFLAGRKEIFKTLSQIRNDKKDIFWFHVSSLGEYEQGKPLIESLKKQYPKANMLISFFSPSGYDVISQKNTEDSIVYIPFDTPKNAKKFIEAVNPNAVFFVKNDFWPCFVEVLSNKNIPFFFISTRFHKKQFFFNPLGSWFRKLLKKSSYLFVQDTASQTLLQEIGINNVAVTGDTRFDNVLKNTTTSLSINHIDNFIGTKNCFVVGSAWEEDMVLLSDVQNQKDLKILIAPHKIDKKSLDKIIQHIKVPYCCYSTFNSKNDVDKNIMILDTIGYLSRLYRFATFAYVGGGMKKKSLHNILEPAVYGIPIIIGNKYHNFPEAVHLLNMKGIVSVGSKKEMNNAVDALLKNEKIRVDMGAINKDFILKNSKSTQKIINIITPHLS